MQYGEITAHRQFLPCIIQALGYSSANAAGISLIRQVAGGLIAAVVYSLL
jgi:hypothetical protein